MPRTLDVLYGPCTQADAPMSRTLEKKVLITNPMGFHMRPAAMFASVARKFQSDVALKKDSLRVNGKSVLDMMILAAEQGTELIIEVRGPDADQALTALIDVMNTIPSDTDADGPLQGART
jgi:phosphocarrier protein HPr